MKRLEINENNIISNYSDEHLYNNSLVSFLESEISYIDGILGILNSGDNNGNQK